MKVAMNPYLLGLDVSKWQKKVDWPYAKSQGVEYVFIKGMEWYWTDEQFYNHWNSSKAAGVKRGSYLYYRDALLPEPQAEKFFELLSGTGDLGELPPALDVESYGNATLTPSKIKLCLERLTTLFGRAPIFYSRTDIVKLIGNPSWLLTYPLWLAHYTLIGWQTNHFEKVKSYPPTLPPPYLEYAVWQFSSSCPAITFQVLGSKTVDTNYAPEEIINAWAGTPPPPDPIPQGDAIMYTAECIYIPPGYTHREIRSRPDSIGTDAGKDGGDIFKGDKDLPVYEIVENAEGKWAHLKKGDVVGWTLYEKGTTVYLKLTPLAPMLQVTAVTIVKLHYWKDLNGVGKPLMVKPENPSKFEFGAAFVVDPVQVDADGDEDYYRVLNPFSASPPALTPPAGYTGWYCKVSETMLKP